MNRQGHWMNSAQTLTSYPCSALELCRELRLPAYALALLATDGLVQFALPAAFVPGRVPRFADVRLREVDADAVRQMLRPENIVNGVIARYLDVLPDVSPLSEYDRSCAIGRFLSLTEAAQRSRRRVAAGGRSR